MAIYYVSNAGSDKFDGLSSDAPLQTIARVNALPLAPGDAVRFRCGDVWREMLTIPTSGLPKIPIVIGAYGKGAPPRITAGDLAKGWQPAGKNIWQTAWLPVPRTVIFDGLEGIPVGSSGALLAATQWYWASGVLSVYVANDPNQMRIESGVRLRAAWLNAKNYIVIDGLQLDLSNTLWPGAAIGDSGANTLGVTIQNCDIRWSAVGVYWYGGTGRDLLIAGNSIHDNDFGVGSGVFSGIPGHEVIVRQNDVYGNGRFTSGDGIHVRGNSWIVEQNMVHDNGSSAYTCIGIHVYTAEDNSEGVGTHNIIRNNRVSYQRGVGNDGSGIETDVYTHHNTIYGNVCWGNDGPGIDIYNSHDVSLYNNTCYGNMQDSARSHNKLAEMLLSANVLNLTATVVVKNNIAVATMPNTYAIYVDAGTSKNAGLDFASNCWMAASPNWYFWNTSGGSNVAVWNALPAVEADLHADPLMTSPKAQDFTLQADSPCVETGSAVGLESQRLLPTIGALEPMYYPPRAYNGSAF